MSTEAAARDVEARAQTILKAVVIESRGLEPTSRTAGDEPDWGQTGVLEPPYDPSSLCLLFEHSNSLRQNIDSYATNIDGFGHRLEAVIELDADNADQRVADIICLERLAAMEKGELPEDASLHPTPEEVAERRDLMQRLARIEKARLEAFFDSCCSEYGFVDLRRRTRQDLEVTGNGFWEVLRNGKGTVARLVHVPSYTVRLLALDAEPIEIEERIRISPVTYDTMTTCRRLRRYVQCIGIERIYFRAFGDPRVVSRKTGRVFEDVDALLAADPDDGPATELIHFSIHSPRSPYGVPRWIGTLLSVLGSRSMEEVNYSYFSNKSVPPLALLVSGGHLSPESVPRIERFIEENLRGKANFHKILVLEAEASAGAGGTQARVELKPLTQAQQQDALFGEYDERNIDKVGSAFRLPRLLRGESKDFNRSTAEWALRFAEEQVFQPSRDEFDFLINRQLLADMGVRFWRFKSQSPITRDPETMTTMVEKLVRVGVLTPEEGRDLAGDIFNHEFRTIDADWARQPIALTLAGIEPQTADAREAATEAPPSTPQERIDLARRYLNGGRQPQAADDNE